MPVKPPPCHYSCPRCGWNKTVAPQSDAMHLGFDTFERCPECGYEDLQQRPPTKRELLLLEVRGLFGWNPRNRR